MCMVGIWLCHIPTLHHYGNVTGGNLLVGHDDDDDDDNDDDDDDLNQSRWQPAFWATQEETQARKLYSGSSEQGFASLDDDNGDVDDDDDDDNDDDFADEHENVGDYVDTDGDDTNDDDDNALHCNDVRWCF